jgi:hypothetical protein
MYLSVNWQNPATLDAPQKSMTTMSVASMEAGFLTANTPFMSSGQILCAKCDSSVNGRRWSPLFVFQLFFRAGHPRNAL